LKEPSTAVMGGRGKDSMRWRECTCEEENEATLRRN